MSEIKFGRVHKPDERDKKYRIKRCKIDRAVRYWPNRVHLNQGSTPACVGYAWAHWLLNAPITQCVNALGIYEIARRFDEYYGENYEGTSVRAGADVLRMLGFVTEYRWAWTLPPVIETLLDKGPIVAGVNWREDMMEPDANGFIHATGAAVGGHAILLNGVNLTEQKIRVHQSWDWCKAWISFADMKRLLSDDGECCLAIEAKPAA